MSSPQDWIKGALRSIGVIAYDETPDSAQIDHGRKKLNQLLGILNLDALTVYTSTRTTKVLTASDNDYTVGSGGDIAITQPVRIERAGLILNGGTLEQELRVIGRDEWESLADKSTTGTPYVLYFQRAANATARGTIYLYYVPDNTHTLVIYTPSRLDSVTAAAVATDYPLLDGYELMIESNLAVLLAPEYERSIRPELASIALESRAKVKGANVEPLILKCDEAQMNRGDGFLPNIFGG